MSAYIVFLREKTHDPEELRAYSPMAKASHEGFPLKMLARYGKQEILEGDPFEGVVILEFPNMKDAKAWYDSPGYRAAREHRFRGADYRVILVEGCRRMLWDKAPLFAHRMNQMARVLFGADCMAFGAICQFFRIWHVASSFQRR